MSMQQFEKWLRSDDKENASLEMMHVLVGTPVDDLVTQDPDPVPLGAWSAGWK